MRKAIVIIILYILLLSNIFNSFPCTVFGIPRSSQKDLKMTTIDDMRTAGYIMAGISFICGLLRLWMYCCCNKPPTRDDNQALIIQSDFDTAG